MISLFDEERSRLIFKVGFPYYCYAYDPFEWLDMCWY